MKDVLKVVVAVVATCILIGPVLVLRVLMRMGVAQDLTGRWAQGLRNVAQRFWTWAHI